MSYVIDYQKSIINEIDIKEAERADQSNDKI